MQNNSSCKEKAIATYNALKKRRAQKNKKEECIIISTLTTSICRCSRKKAGQNKYNYH